MQNAHSGARFFIAGIVNPMLMHKKHAPLRCTTSFGYPLLMRVYSKLFNAKDYLGVTYGSF